MNPKIRIKRIYQRENIFRNDNEIINILACSPNIKYKEEYNFEGSENGEPTLIITCNQKQTGERPSGLRHKVR